MNDCKLSPKNVPVLDVYTDVKASYLRAQELGTIGWFIPRGAERGDAADMTCPHYWDPGTYWTKNVL